MDFQCLRCGDCCRRPGEVRLREGEAEAIATHLSLEVGTFTEHYTRLREDRRGLSLCERPDGACIFLEGPPASCSIQAAKPGQCRDFPSHWQYEKMPSNCAAAGVSVAATVTLSPPTENLPNPLSERLR
ncbi:MAG: YkgJ family cysteine cluster protein [bacterium]